MANITHPFYEIAELAASDGPEGLTLMVERGGDYVRLVQNTPPVFFKYKPDAADPFDRTRLDDFKRLMLSEEDCADGPEATLDLIRHLLAKFADYSVQPGGKAAKPAAKPKTSAKPNFGKRPPRRA